MPQSELSLLRNISGRSIVRQLLQLLTTNCYVIVRFYYSIGSLVNYIVTWSGDWQGGVC